MDRETVDPGKERWDAGQRILDLTDELSFVASAAAWIYDPEPEAWRYYLISPMVAEKGPRWIYDRLLKVFNKVELPPGITPLDIYVSDPNEPFFQSLMKAGVARQIRSSISEIKRWPGMETNSFRTRIVPDTGPLDAKPPLAFFYRLEESPSRASSSHFDKKVQQLLAA